MIYRVSLFTCKKKYLIVVMAGLSGIAQFASAAEINSGELRPGLSLFISTPEQRNLEKEQRDIESDLKETNATLVTAIDDGIEPVGIAIEKLTSEKTTAEKITTEGENYIPQRYDGVIFRGDQVLSIWFDGSRHAKSSGSPGFQIEFINKSGRIGLSTDDGSYELSPGDVLPLQQHTSEDLMSVATGAIDGAMFK